MGHFTVTTDHISRRQDTNNACQSKLKIGPIDITGLQTTGTWPTCYGPVVTCDKLAQGTNLRLAKIQDGPENPDSIQTLSLTLTLLSLWLILILTIVHNTQKFN